MKENQSRQPSAPSTGSKRPRPGKPQSGFRTVTGAKTAAKPRPPRKTRAGIKAWGSIKLAVALGAKTAEAAPPPPEEVHIHAAAAPEAVLQHWTLAMLFHATEANFDDIELVCLPPDELAARAAARDKVLKGMEGRLAERLEGLVRSADRLTASQISTELADRQLPITGFVATDVEVLQKAFDAEVTSESARVSEAMRAEATVAADALDAAARRVASHSAIREEQAIVVKLGPRITSWLTLLHSNRGPRAAKLTLCSVSARVMAKALWGNTHLVSLDLSSCGLDDHAGCYVARPLRDDGCALRTLELNDNELGPRTCVALAEAVGGRNTCLSHLSLEGNPLTDGGKSERGCRELFAALASNAHLRTLRLYRTDATSRDLGERLTLALGVNGSITSVTLACWDDVPLAAQKAVLRRLAENETRAVKTKAELRAAKTAARDAQDAAATAAKSAEEERELNEWLHMRREERHTKRYCVDKAAEEAAIAAEVAAREEAAAAAAARAASKKKRRRKGKGKKGKQGKRPAGRPGGGRRR